MFLSMIFLKEQIKSLKNSRKGVLFLSETYLKHSKRILNNIPNAYAPTITSEEHKSI